MIRPFTEAEFNVAKLECEKILNINGFAGFKIVVDFNPPYSPLDYDLSSSMESGILVRHPVMRLMKDGKEIESVEIPIPEFKDIGIIDYFCNGLLMLLNKLFPRIEVSKWNIPTGTIIGPMN